MSPNSKINNNSTSRSVPKPNQSNVKLGTNKASKGKSQNPPKKTHSQPVLKSMSSQAMGGAFTTPALVGWNEDKSYQALDEFKSRNSAYLQTLLNPWSCHGIGIPADSLASVKVSVTRRLSVSIDTNGNGFWTWGLSAGGVDGTTATLANDYWVNNGFLGPERSIKHRYSQSSGAFVGGGPVFQGQYSNGTSALDVNNLFKITSTSGIITTAISSWELPENVQSFLQDNFTALRVCSAGFTVNTTSSALENKGLLSVASLPRTYFDSIKAVGRGDAYAGVVPTDDFVDLFGDISTYPGSIVLPLNKGVGATGRYFPYDPPTRTYATIPVPDSFAEIIDPNGLDDSYRPGFMMFTVTGAEPSTTLIVDVILNLEGLPTTNTLLQTTTTTNLHDDMELDHAMDVCQREPPCFAGSEMSTHGVELGSMNGPNLATVRNSVAASRPLMSGVHLHSQWNFRNTNDHRTMVLRGTDLATVFSHGPGLGKTSFMKKMGSVLSSVGPTVRMIDKIVTKFAPIISKL